MRGEEPNRHGRAADALIAHYLRELAAHDDDPTHGVYATRPASTVETTTRLNGAGIRSTEATEDAGDASSPSTDRQPLHAAA